MIGRLREGRPGSAGPTLTHSQGGGVVLASASPRRHELLRSIGLGFRVAVADVDESILPDESAVAYVDRVALSKAETVAERLGHPADTVVLAADTTVDLDGNVLAKPSDDDDARRMLRALSGRSHEVHTAVVCWSRAGVGRTVVTTAVTFVDLTDAAIDRYLATGEHLDKAGAYGMQGAAGMFVSEIVGSPSNVIGLPLAQTLELLAESGITIEWEADLAGRLRS